jgi:predicted regulator of Ras-like GTPase activity (Roadblock/LC7/MglB family)
VTGPSSDHAADPPNVVSHVGTEFGRVLVDLVVAVPGALGAVFSDKDGYAVDFAVVPTHVEGLDVQIAGAQLGLLLSRAHDTTVRHRIGLTTASVLVEAERGALLGALVELDERSVLVLMLAPNASIGRALVRFDRARSAIATLLR